MATGKMEEETRELLDYYNELYNWEYNDMVDYMPLNMARKNLEIIISHFIRRLTNEYLYIAL